MSTRLPRYNSDTNAWITLNNFFNSLSEISDVVKIKRNGNNPPTVEATTQFLVHKDRADTISNVDADGNPVGSTGNNEYPISTSITYLISEAIYETTDQVFTWGSGLFPVISDGVWSLYCSGSLDQDETTIGQGSYGAELGAPIYSEEKGGFYRSEKKVIAMFRVASSVIEEIITLSNNQKVYNNDVIDGNFILNNSIESAGMTGLLNGEYMTDMIKYFENMTTLSIDSAIDTTIPLYPGIGNLKATVSTPQASTGIAEYSYLSYFIEGYEFENYHEKGFLTLNFIIRSGIAGTMCIAFRNNGQDRSYIVETIINNTNVWEEKTVIIPIIEKAGTWNYTNNVGLEISWILTAGTNYHTTKDVWGTGNKLATSNQTNFCGSAHDVYISHISCTRGHRKYDWGNYQRVIDFDKQKRYYEVLTPWEAGSGFNNTSTQTIIGHRYEKEKRTVPTVDLSLFTTANYRIADIAGINAPSSVVLFQASNKSLRLSATKAATTAARVANGYSTGTGEKIHVDARF